MITPHHHAFSRDWQALQQLKAPASLMQRREQEQMEMMSVWRHCEKGHLYLETSHWRRSALVRAPASRPTTQTHWDSASEHVREFEETEVRNKNQAHIPF